MKTNELTGAALDWTVAAIEANAWGYFSPSANWTHGGPIIEREMIEIGAHEPEGFEWVARDYWKENTMTGSTPLIAAMRCYVASKLGDDIDVPEELK
jgi:hypothetical protein